jgi:clan AA aspartic protease
MITGLVNPDYEAVIRLRIQGPGGHDREVDAVIDTGFNGFLTLPPFLLTGMGLARLSRGRALLANGSEEVFDIYGVTVLRDGQERHVEVTGVNATPLVGMSLLDGYDLHIRVADGGHVVIQSFEQGSLSQPH